MTDHAPKSETSETEKEHEFIRRDIPQSDAPGGGDAPPDVRSARPERERHRYEKKKSKGARSDGERRIDEQLTEIYENQDGTLPDMKKFQKRQRNRLISAFLTLAFSCLFLASVAGLGLYLWSPGGQFMEEEVIVSVSGESEVTAGQDMVYRIRYRNHQSVPLAKVSLEIQYPDGFVFASSSVPSISDAHDEWALGSLEADESGIIDIHGTLYGSVGEEQQLRVFFNYTPANFNSEFQKVATMTTAVASGEVELSVTGPSEVVPGEEATFTLTLKNTSDHELPPLRVELDPGHAFTKKSSDPAATQFNGYEWAFDAIGDEKKIVLTGSFAKVGDGGAPALTVRVIGTPPGFPSDTRYVYGSATHAVTFSAARDLLSVVVSGVRGDTSAEPGRALTTTVVLKNTTDVPFTNAKVTMMFDAPSNKDRSMIRWSSIVDAQNGDVVGEQLSSELRRGSITWTPREVPALASVAPGQEVSITFEVPLKSASETDYTTFADTSILAVAEVAYTKADEATTASSAPAKIVVNSDVSFETRAETQGDRYAITWLLSNSIHTLRDIRVTADLYGPVNVDASQATVPAGTITYEGAKQTFVWNIPEMSTAVDVLALQFPVTLREKNPTQTTLVSKVTLEATDAVTGKRITKEGAAIPL